MTAPLPGSKPAAATTPPAMPATGPDRSAELLAAAVRQHLKIWAEADGFVAASDGAHGDLPNLRDALARYNDRPETPVTESPRQLHLTSCSDDCSGAIVVGVFWNRRHEICSCTCHLIRAQLNPPKGPSGVSRPAPKKVEHYFGGLTPSHVFVDEAARFEATGRLDPADSGIPLDQWRKEFLGEWNAQPYQIPPLDRLLDARRRGGAVEDAYAITADGKVTDTCQFPDMLRNDVLVTSRGFGKQAAADEWRNQRLDELEAAGGGIVATFISRAVKQLAQHSLAEREVEAAKAFHDGVGLAVIRGELTTATGGGSEDLVTLRVTDTYIPTSGIPAGVIYDFPHQQAFDAWKERTRA